MSGPYTEGWPKAMEFTDFPEDDVEVVPLSDAEKMRKALEWIASQEVEPFSKADQMRSWADQVVNPVEGPQVSGEETISAQRASLIQKQAGEIEELNRLVAQYEMKIEELEAALDSATEQEEPPHV